MSLMAVRGIAAVGGEVCKPRDAGNDGERHKVSTYEASSKRQN
jgi:hypothetical protein